jgi:predicted RNA-binding protein with PUA-like domain
MPPAACWLLKTEPGSYSWEDLVRDQRTAWDGIKNPLALKNLRSASRGDEVIIYHTGSERRAMGMARIVKQAYPDPKLSDPKRLVVDVEAVQPLAAPVTLEQIKGDPAFAGWDLLRLSRLSFVPVPPAMRRRLLTMAKTG